MGREDGKAQSTHRPQIDEEGAVFLEVIAVDMPEQVLVVCIVGKLLGVLLEKEEMTEEEIVTWCDRLRSVNPSAGNEDKRRRVLTRPCLFSLITVIRAW